MTNKLFVSALITLSVGAVSAFGQQTTAPIERRIERVILSAPTAGGYLGVQTIEITKENFGKYGLRDVRGVAVEQIVKDSPAAQAGLQAGDVIVRFGGEEVSSVHKLTRLLSEVAPDHQSKITVFRNGGEVELTATLGKREAPRFENNGTLDRLYGLPGIPEYPRLPPMPPDAGLMPTPFPFPGDGENVFVYPGGAARQIGVNAMPLTEQLGDYFGVAGGEGLLISTVRENSAAARAGLKAGDVITEVDGKTVKNTAQLIRALGERKEGDVTLTIVRDKNRQTIKVTPEKSKAAPAPFQYFGNSNEGDLQQKRLRQPLPQAPTQK